MPVEIRRRLSIEAGDDLSFIVKDDGTVELRPAKYSTIAALAGAAGKLPVEMSWDEVERIAREDRAKAISQLR